MKNYIKKNGKLYLRNDVEVKLIDYENQKAYLESEKSRAITAIEKAADIEIKKIEDEIEIIKNLK